MQKSNCSLLNINMEKRLLLDASSGLQDPAWLNNIRRLRTLYDSRHHWKAVNQNFTAGLRDARIMCITGIIILYEQGETKSFRTSLETRLRYFSCTDCIFYDFYEANFWETWGQYSRLIQIVRIFVMIKLDVLQILHT